MKLLRKLVMVAVAGLIGWGGQPAGWADAMLPRYRIEDMGLASQFTSFDVNPNFWFLSDGAIWANRVSLDSIEKLYRKGEYLRSDQYSSKGVLEKYILRKNGSEINLLENINPNLSNLETFSSLGQALFWEVPVNGKYLEYVYDTTTGEKTSIDLNLSPIGIQRTYGMNQVGEMVGRASFGYDVPGAIYYPSIASKAVLLSTLVDNLKEWRLESATDINDSGEIIGWGYDLQVDDSLRVFKLTPIAQVPEPSTWLIFGLGSLWLLRKRFSS